MSTSHPLPSNPYGLTGVLHDFGQGTFEVYQRRVTQAAADNFFPMGSGNSGVTATAAVHGAVVRSSVSLGILKELSSDSVDDLPPPAVAWLAEQIRQHVVRVTSPAVDPN